MRLNQETNKQGRYLWRPISRIAPTPSGYLHAGNAINFIITYLFTRSQNGFLHLRIDDYDLARYKDEYVLNIFDVLEFLRLDYDAGARNLAEFRSKFSSAFRSEIYKQAVKNLKDTYFCSCSKHTSNAYKNGIYTGICRDKNLPFISGQTALKMKCELNLGDFVLFRKDGFVAYNFASVVDDELLGVNFIVRGADLFECSQAQKFLANKLNYKFQNCEILHHELLKKDGIKLSKSQKAPPINLKESPQIYYKMVAKMLGLNPKSSQNLNTLLEEFKEQKSQLLAKFC